MYKDKVVMRYAYLRRHILALQGTVFHSTRKWFITQCERTGTPEHFTASIVGHQSARSENKLTYGLYSAGISDEQKRGIIDQVRLPAGVTP
jgi:hypothetical protein